MSLLILLDFQVWKNDRNYQLQLLKSRVSALPDKPEIFNRHLPGPNNEGLLLVNDEGITADVQTNGDQLESNVRSFLILLSRVSVTLDTVLCMSI